MTSLSRGSIVLSLFLECLGAVITPAVLAQIPVTGGRTAGDAAFFVPNTGNTVLFDSNTRMLRLETPNGVTVNSRFTPTSGNLDPTTGVPQGGETGVLQGTLSGRAFTAAGTPVFFQGVSTTLDFSLTSFDANTVLEGTLIIPTGTNTVPLVFLPATSATLSTESSGIFEATVGELHVGEFTADFSSGSIGLPPDVQFTPMSDIITFDGSSFFGRAATNFQLQGSGEGTTNFSTPNGSDRIVRFDSKTATTEFKIQGRVNDSQSGEGNSRAETNVQSGNTNLQISGNNFKIEGTIAGPVNFWVGGVSNTAGNNNSTFSGETQFQINGTGTGSTGFDKETGSISFNSPQSETQIQIQGDRFQFNGTATGETSFNLGWVGLGSFQASAGDLSRGSIFSDAATPTNTAFGSGFPGLRSQAIAPTSSTIPRNSNPSIPTIPTPTLPASSNPATANTPSSPLTLDSEPLEILAPPASPPPLPSSDPAVSPEPVASAEPPASPVSVPPPVLTNTLPSVATPVHADSLPPVATPAPVASPPPVATPAPAASPPPVATPAPTAMPAPAPNPVPPVALAPPPQVTSEGNPLTTLILSQRSTTVSPLPTTTSLNIFTPSSISQSSSEMVYKVYSTSLGALPLQRGDDSSSQRVVRQGGRAYKLVGPSSRVFPGLTGVREVSGDR